MIVNLSYASSTETAILTNVLYVSELCLKFLFILGYLFFISVISCVCQLFL